MEYNWNDVGNSSRIQNKMLGFKTRNMKYFARHWAHNPPSAGQGYFSQIQFVSAHCVRCDLANGWVGITRRAAMAGIQCYL